MGKAIVSISKQINATAIIAFTFKGRTASNISKFRPTAIIIALSNSVETINKLCLRWGVIPLFLDEIHKEHLAVDKAKEQVIKEGHVKEGDVVVFAAGAPSSEKSRANWLRLEVI